MKTKSGEHEESSRPEAVAVIGMSCRFPGGADDPQSFWKLLRDGRDAVTEIPRDRWDIDAYYDQNPEASGKMYTRHGAFLDGERLRELDAKFFGIAPREAELMDPQQRMVLEVSWEAIESAGINPHSLAGSATGMFIGAAATDFQRVTTQFEHTAYTNSGASMSVIPGRVSYFLGLRGPSMIIDTACSASLVAIHQACESLRRGESSLALAGGVMVMLVPGPAVSYCRARMLATDGRCKAFDAAADGFSRGEGCGVIVLKRLADAKRDGDRILAVVRGSAINQDGASGGLTVPSGQAQRDLIQSALSGSGVSADQVDYVEAHGTGTSLGDPIEARALGAVLSKGRSPERALLIGSVKANIGHLEAGAGIASVIKVILSLEHEEIPPLLHYTKPNPMIDFAALGLRVPAKVEPWPRKDGRSRIAGVSGFAFQGSNAHVLIEESPREEAPASRRSSPRPLVLPLSARSEQSLRGLAAKYAERIAAEPAAAADICFTAAIARAHLDFRAVVIAPDAASLASRLRELSERGEGRGIFLSAGSVKSAGVPVAFLFGGKGPIDEAACAALRESEPEFRKAFDECGGTAASGERKLFAFEYALTSLWRSWGIKPAIVFGQGAGELVAATVAGAMSVPDALKLFENRERGAAAVRFEKLHLPAISSLSGALVKGDELASADYWHRQAAGSAKVEEGMKALADAGVKRFLEIGPWPAHAGASTVYESLARIYVQGQEVDWAGFGRESGCRKVPVPTYVFSRKRHWPQAPGEAAPRAVPALAPADDVDRLTDAEAEAELTRQLNLHFSGARQSNRGVSG